MLVRRGVNLTLADEDGNGNLAMLLYNPANPLERLNLPDTLKCQHTFRITAGHCLYSDMGRIFCSVIKDDVGWHDPAGGTCNKALVESKWGSTTYQGLRNDVIRNGRDSFLIELAKYGLGKRDMAANMNWFSRVDVSTGGAMSLATDNSKPGAAVTLRFEMDTLVLMHSCPHPMQSTEDYPRRPIKYRLSLADAVTEDDACLNARPENGRGFANTQLYVLGGG
jgi:urea carboxylase-associated protein 2